ncbi:MAG: putative sulfate/molybdate transporter [Dehalococcoidia bacterium]|nr:putative sulfate/molybdate transporter [Dehalococcoidia bacterium]
MDTPGDHAVNLSDSGRVAASSGLGDAQCSPPEPPASAGPFGRLRTIAWQVVFGGNVYNRSEFAGAFGDLGSLIPFVLAYITINGMDPAGILLSFGISKIFVGAYFKTPISVQPMKAIGATAIANPGAISHGMIWGSGLFSAAFWTIMALTGAIDWLARVTSRPVMRGIMLGLGVSFMLTGLDSMKEQPLTAVAGVVLTFMFLSSQRIPAMLVLLALGVVISFVLNPALAAELGQISVRFRLPDFALGQMSWNDLLMGTLILGIPQVPLTLGNAILGISAENNALFPDRPVKARTIALDHGLMNFVSAAIGGVPLCHGAGGMAGHVRFGAKTGGALVILGLILTILGLFFSDSVGLLFQMLPTAILGVILFFAGLNLAATARDIGTKKEDIYVMLATAGIATFNMGIAFVAGMALYYGMRRGVVKA